MARPVQIPAGMVGESRNHARPAICRSRLISIVCLASALSACDTGGNADRLVAEGVALAQAGDTAAALASFDRALARDPDHPAALVNGGLAALLDGRPAEARARLERYLAGNETDVMPRVYLAHARLALDDRDGAFEALRQAVQLGFRDLDSLADGSFAPVRNDIRFIQLASLAAQKQGRRIAADDRGRPLLGTTPVRSLSAPGIESACNEPASPMDE